MRGASDRWEAQRAIARNVSGFMRYRPPVVKRGPARRKKPDKAGRLEHLKLNFGLFGDEEISRGWGRNCLINVDITEMASDTEGHGMTLIPIGSYYQSVPKPVALNF